MARNLPIVVLCGLLSIGSAVGQSSHPANSILNLYDAFGYGKRNTIMDWGYSALIHYNGKTILFDSGNNNDIFEHNVKALGVDLSKVDIAVLSHYHADHFSGFDYLLRVNPNVKIYLPDEPELGAPVDFTFSSEPEDEFKRDFARGTVLRRSEKIHGLSSHRPFPSLQSRICNPQPRNHAGSIHYCNACIKDGLLRCVSAKLRATS